MAKKPLPTTQGRGHYLTLEQGADRAQLSVRTIRRYIAQGQLTAYRIGRVTRLLPQDLDALFTPTDQWTGGAA